MVLLQGLRAAEDVVSFARSRPSQLPPLAAHQIQSPAHPPEPRGAPVGLREQGPGIHSRLSLVSLSLASHGFPHLPQAAISQGRAGPRVLGPLSLPAGLALCTFLIFRAEHPLPPCCPEPRVPLPLL